MMFQAHIQAAIENATSGATGVLLGNIKQEKYEIPNPQDMDQMILQIEKNGMYADVERNVRAVNLLEAEARKKHLAEKLD